VTSASAVTSLKGRDFVSFGDLDRSAVERVFARAIELKTEYLATGVHADPPLRGRSLAMLFEHPSLRTRVTFEAGMTQLGGHGIYLAAGDVGLGQRETVGDVAHNLERFVEGIMARMTAHDVVEQLAVEAAIPVINALTLREHPCQALADLLTAQERFGRLEGLTLAYVGDGNNVAHSLLTGCALAGMNVRVATPPGYEPISQIVKRAEEIAATSGARVTVTTDAAAAADGADVLYTDVWASMGQEGEADERKLIFAPYQVNAALVARAAPTAIVMHCLPAHRGEEITDDVIEGPQSVVWEQAENRLHAQKALLEWLLK
jgi:ornithine carbamoyltransferase